MRLIVATSTAMLLAAIVAGVKTHAATTPCAVADLQQRAP